jgi:hypothetical protein
MTTMPNNKHFTTFDSRNDRQTASYSRRDRHLSTTKEGVIVNTFVKDSINNNLNDIYRHYLIPETTSLPDELTKNDINKTKATNPLLTLAATTLGVLGGVALVTKGIQNSAKLKLKLPKWEQLPDVPRNMNLDSETHFVTYMAVQNPTTKNILSAMAVFAFTSAAFVMKNFVDGFSEIWVKKQDANIQRDLQEKLIKVETRSFAGKNQIIRNMMNEKAKELNEIISKIIEKPAFDKGLFRGFSINTSFGSTKKEQNEAKKDDNIKPIIYAATGILTLGASVLLAKSIHKNISKTAKIMKDYKGGFENQIETIINRSKNEISQNDQNTLKQLFSIVNHNPEFIKENLQKTGMPENEINKLTEEIAEKNRRFVEPPEAIGGKKGIQYYTYINEVQGHLYNWLMNTDSQVAKVLFMALTTVTGLGYVGQKAVESVKEIQVKKVNAQTDYDLHDRLVEVELKNFLTKKNSSINPLMEEFKTQSAKTNDKKAMESMADGILYEIKNGAPFVYS